MARFMRRYGQYDLRPPVVVADAPGPPEAFYGLRVKLTTPSEVERRRQFLRYRLYPPTVVDIPEFFSGPQITLTRITVPPKRGLLRPPAVIGAGVVNPGLRIRLTTPSEVERLRQNVSYKLSPPTVLFTPEVFFGPKTHPTLKSRRPVATYDLGPPIVVSRGGNLGWIGISLAPSSRGRPKSKLSPPTVLEVAQAFYGPEVSLAPSSRGVPRSRLIPPAAIGAGVVFPGLRRMLVFGKRPVTKSRLSPPAVITAVVTEVFYGPQVWLALSRRGNPFSLLQPPAVVAPVLFFGPATELAPSFRGTPKSRLEPPAVVSQPPAYQQVLPPWLTYSRRGKAKSFLKPPTRVFPFIARPTVISLVAQARGKPKSFLQPPRVVHLAVEILGPEISLARIRPPRVHSRLQPPAVVTAREIARAFQINLTYSRRPKALSGLGPPTIVELLEGPHGGPLVSLAPSFRGRAKSLLKPPTVVGTGVAFYGPQITLVRIRPPRTHYLLKQIFVPFRRPGGDVCGFDIAGSFICSLELPGTQVTGFDSAGAQVTGASAAGTKVTGSDSAGGSVFGTDQEAT